MTADNMLDNVTTKALETALFIGWDGPSVMRTFTEVMGFDVLVSYQEAMDKARGFEKTLMGRYEGSVR